MLTLVKGVVIVVFQARTSLRETICRNRKCHNVCFRLANASWFHHRRILGNGNFQAHILRACSLKLLTEKSWKLLLLWFEPASGNWEQCGKVWVRKGKIYRSRAYTLDFRRFFPSPLLFLFSQMVSWLIYGTVILKWRGDSLDVQAKMICTCLTATLYILNSAFLFSNNPVVEPFAFLNQHYHNIKK